LNLQRPRREARTSGGRSSSRVVKAAAEGGRRPADRAAIRASPSPATKNIKTVATLPFLIFLDYRREDLNLQRPRREARTSGGRSSSRVVKAAAEGGRRPADRAAIRVTPLSSTNKDVQFQQKFAHPIYMFKTLPIRLCYS
jgi:hypothetical protein